MALESTHGQMETDMRGSTWMETEQARASFPGEKALNGLETTMKATLRME